MAFCLPPIPKIPLSLITKRKSLSDSRHSLYLSQTNICFGTLSLSLSTLGTLSLSDIIHSQMLCRILMWEGRFCVFVTVASTFSGFRPWVRKYPSIFAHCLKYRQFWLKVFIDELLCMYLVFSGWICCSCFWVFFLD